VWGDSIQGTLKVVGAETKRLKETGVLGKGPFYIGGAAEGAGAVRKCKTKQGLR